MDPSSRGGIAAYTVVLARALSAVGASGELVVSREVGELPPRFSARRWLPDVSWGRPAGAGTGFYLKRAAEWTSSAAAVSLAALLRPPEVIHLQAPINRRLDPLLIRPLRRLAAVAWTAHDVVPPEATPGDAGRFAAIYRAVDLVIVHSEPSAAQVKQLCGVDALVIEQPPSDVLSRVSRAEARRQLALPPDERVVAALGFVRPYKGYELLAGVWEALGASAPVLLVMGEVTVESEWAVLDRLDRCARAVVRPGYASDEQLHLAIAASDALLLPYDGGSNSGVVQLARSMGVPVLASDAPQLAATVESARAGAVIPRTLSAWCEAVTGPLPPPPPPPPPLDVIGRAHLDAYASVAQRKEGAHRRRRRA